MTRRMNAKKISKSILALLMAVPALFTTNAHGTRTEKADPGRPYSRR